MYYSVKADSLYKYNSTKTFDSKTELYWDEMEQIWFFKKVGKLGVEYFPLWKNFSILYHIHGILNLVLAGNSNVVEFTKESCNYSKNLPLLGCVKSPPGRKEGLDDKWFQLVLITIELQCHFLQLIISHAEGKMWL